HRFDQIGAGPANRLPDALRAKMERSFGHDFSNVRVREAPGLLPLAFARGDELHFRPGEYDPHSRAGQRLIGHELAHVKQQAEGRVAAPQAKEAAVVESDALEREAD